MHPLYRIFSFLLQILLFFHTFADGAPAAVGGVDVYIRPSSPPKTGVELDQGLAMITGQPDYLPGSREQNPPYPNRLVFTAHWSNTGKLSDGQLVQLAMDGYLDMLASADLYKLNKKYLPGVMTVFHWGSEVILASSQKGGRALTYTQDSVFLGLVNACITDVKTNEAKCGEMSAGQIFQKMHPGTNIKNAKITTVTVIAERDKTGYAAKSEADLKVWPPCQGKNGKGGGCNEIVGDAANKILLREVKPDTKPAPWSSSGWQRTPVNELSFAAPAQ